MKRVLTAITLTLLVFVAAPARADLKTHKSAQVQFWVPDDWKLEGEEANQLTVTDPKGQVGLLFFIKDGKDIKAALAALDEVIAKIATDVKVTNQQKTTLNGMEAVIVDGTGKAEGKPIELSVLVVKTPAKKYLAVFGVIEPAVKKKHEANLVKILGSLKPVKAGKFGN
jgi:hypothetical protein